MSLFGHQSQTRRLNGNLDRGSRVTRTAKKVNTLKLKKKQVTLFLLCKYIRGALALTVTHKLVYYVYFSLLRGNRTRSSRRFHVQVMRNVTYNMSRVRNRMMRDNK